MHTPVAIEYAIAVIAALAALAPGVAAAGGPNVIVIFADDQGSIDAGVYGSDDLETPAIDSLARRGVRFTQFYSAAPVCSPSRAGLLTGRYPWHVGVPTNAGPGPPENLVDLAAADVPQRLRDEEVTLAEMFRGAGYRTAHIGKWHLGYGPGSKPLDQGFDLSFGHMGGCIDNFSHFMYWNGPNRHDLWKNNQRVRRPGRYFPDLMVEEAAEFIRADGERPFFIYFALNAPHYPYQGDARWLKRYEDLTFPRDLYAAFLSTTDERVGRLLAVLDELKLRQDTIVIYQSDNGHSREVRAHLGGGSAGPYRGEKFSLFEGGIRLPAIISWPGTLPEGEVRGQMAHAIDWLPTLAELCSVPLPERELHGHTLVDVLHSDAAASPHDVLRWNTGKQWAVRRGPWKLIHHPRTSDPELPLAEGNREWFLANLDEDLGERNNIAAEHPEIVEHLKALGPE